MNFHKIVFPPYIKTFEKYARFKLEKSKKIKKKVRLLEVMTALNQLVNYESRRKCHIIKPINIFLINEANPSSQIFDKESHDLRNFIDDLRRCRHF